MYLKGKIARGDYTYYKNRLTSVLRGVKRLYYTKLLFDAADDHLKLWNCLNNVIERDVRQSMKKIKVNNIVLMGQDLANYVNDYFLTTVSSITRNLPPSVEFIFVTPPVQNSCYFFPTTRLEVMKVIRGLKNKGNKLFDIHPSIIKDNIDFFSTHLTDLYNMSLIESLFPDQSKIGSHSSSQIGSNRYIRQLSSHQCITCFSKVFEKLTFTRMDNFVRIHNVLSSYQFGFRQGKNTTHAIIRLLSYIVPAFHETIYNACFFLDLRKAFDTVNHEILLKKLQHHGFRGHCRNYLKSYFNNRIQYVYINGFNLNLIRWLLLMAFRKALYSVPFASTYSSMTCHQPLMHIQSCLQMMLHLLLLLDHCRSCMIRLLNFSLIWLDIWTWTGWSQIHQKVSLWCFHLDPHKICMNLFLQGRLLSGSMSLSILAWLLQISCFANHINRVALNISRITGIFTNVRSIVPYHIVMKLYFALAFPHLMNHVVIWGSAPLCHLKILATRQNNMLRVMSGVRWVDGRPDISTREMYKSNGVININSIFKYCLFKLIRQLLDGRLPEFFRILLEPHISHHTYGTRGGRFRHPALVSEVERRFLSHQLISLYDSLSGELLTQNLTRPTSLRNFKSFLLNSQ